MRTPATASQTVGPFFKLGLEWLNVEHLAPADVAGERVTVQGRVLDGDGLPVPDAVIEIWQANSHGRYAHPEDPQEKPLETNFQGYGRVPTSAEGTFRFTTIKPGSVPAPDGANQASHLAISIFMRGLLKRLVTRMYFTDDALSAADPILRLVEPSRRSTLIAKPTATPGVLEWNVILQGAGETVFFDVGL